MRKIFLSLLVISIVSCRFFGGERVSGNGNIKTEKKNINAFNSVRVSGAMTVHLKQDNTTSVKIEADENLMQFIDVYTDGSTLVVRSKDGYNLDPSKEIIVYAAAPVFIDVDVSGSGNVIGDNTLSGSESLNVNVSGSGNIKMDVNMQKITTKVSGSGSIQLKGHSKEFSVTISGSGNINCFDLNTENADVQLSGSANAEVTAQQKLDVEISGSGKVRYKGNAAVNQQVSGSGSIEKVS